MRVKKTAKNAVEMYLQGSAVDDFISFLKSTTRLQVLEAVEELGLQTEECSRDSYCEAIATVKEFLS